MKHKLLHLLFLLFFAFSASAVNPNPVSPTWNLVAKNPIPFHGNAAQFPFNLVFEIQYDGTFWVKGIHRETDQVGFAGVAWEEGDRMRVKLYSIDTNPSSIILTGTLKILGTQTLRLLDGILWTIEKNGEFTKKNINANFSIKPSLH